MNYSITPIIEQAIANGQISKNQIYVCHEITAGGWMRVITQASGQRTGVRRNSKGKIIDHSTWYMYILTPEGVNISGKGPCSNSIKGYSPEDEPRANRLGFRYDPNLARTLEIEFGTKYDYTGYLPNLTGEPGISASNDEIIYKAWYRTANRKLSKLLNSKAFSI